MSENYKFFQNSQCEFFPCHQVTKDKEKDYSCMFCYCPLYSYSDCGGNYMFLSNGIKDCSKCLIPHYNYDYIVDQLIERNNK